MTEKKRDLLDRKRRRRSYLRTLRALRLKHKELLSDNLRRVREIPAQAWADAEAKDSPDGA